MSLFVLVSNWFADVAPAQQRYGPGDAATTSRPGSYVSESAEAPYPFAGETSADEIAADLETALDKALDTAEKHSEVVELDRQPAADQPAA